MHLVASRPSGDEPRLQRTALSQYVRRIASGCSDPGLTRQLIEIARHYENRMDGSGRHSLMARSREKELA